MIRVGVVGATGRTGRYVVEALQGRDDSILHAAVVSLRSASVGHDVVGTGLRYSGELDALGGADVVIEFTNAETSLRVAQWCASHKVPVLIATTGHSAEQRRALESCGIQTALGITPNTSLGAAVLGKLAAEAKGLLGGSFDIEVLDIHHRMKRDAPSGTARSVTEVLANESQQVVFGREGQRNPGEIGVVALRGGDVVGDHTVFFLGNGERLEVTHRVSSRSVFGQGAVALAFKLLGMPTGVYSALELMAA
jgi:4-hydroxy-tetrahydrodipicolinate reductase